MQRTAFFLLAAAMMLTPRPALAEDNATKLRVELESSYISRSKVDGGPGRFERISAGLRIDWSRFRLRYDNSRYLWSNVAGLPFGNGRDDPWEELHFISVGRRLCNGTFAEDFAYAVQVQANSAFESQMSDSFGLGASGILGYDVWEGLMINLKGRLDGYHPRDGILKLAGELWFTVSLPERKIRAWLGEHGLPAGEGGLFDMDVSLAATRRFYRLADASPVARKGYLVESATFASAYVVFAPWENVRFFAGPEFHIQRSFQIQDASGTLQEAVKAGNAFGVRGGLEATF